MNKRKEKEQWDKKKNKIPIIEKHIRPTPLVIQTNKSEV